MGQAGGVEAYLELASLSPDPALQKAGEIAAVVPRTVLEALGVW